MAEWSNAAVLKTVDLNGSGGSNPSLSAEKWLTGICRSLFLFNIPKNIPFLNFGRKRTCAVMSCQELDPVEDFPEKVQRPPVVSFM